MKRIIAIVALVAAVSICVVAPAAATGLAEGPLLIPDADPQEPLNVAVTVIRDDAGNVWQVIFDDKNMDGQYDPRDGDVTLQVRQIAWGD